MVAALTTVDAAHEELALQFYCVLPAFGEQALTFIFYIPCRFFSVNTIVRRDPYRDKLGDTGLLKIPFVGFPGGAVVESPPADSGDVGSCPGPGGSHMPRSGWAREPWPLSLRVRSLCSATGEATTVRGPRTAKK